MSVAHPHIQIISSTYWYYAPTLSKNGKKKYANDRIEVVHATSKIFSEPVMVTSDLHGHGLEVFQDLEAKIGLQDFSVITAGDMAGLNIRGSDGDPTELYEFIVDHAQRLYFVQGNHDLPDTRHKELELKNSDNTLCMLQNSQILKTYFGNVAGINGTISRKRHPYKMPDSEFYDLVKKTFSRKLPVDFFITHETPALPATGDFPATTGKSTFFELIRQFQPRVHIYGHCHHKNISRQIGNTLFINVDARVLIFTNQDIII